MANTRVIRMVWHGLVWHWATACIYTTCAKAAWIVLVWRLCWCETEWFHTDVNSGLVCILYVYIYYIQLPYLASSYSLWVESTLGVSTVLVARPTRTVRVVLGVTILPMKMSLSPSHHVVISRIDSSRQIMTLWTLWWNVMILLHMIKWHCQTHVAF